MKINKLLVATVVIAIIILVGVTVYKLIIEPAQIKKEYVTCVENAKTVDYERWQEIERQIEEKDILVKKLGIEADERYDRFLENKSVENIYTDCMKEYKEECLGALENQWKQLSCNLYKDGDLCVTKTHDDVYKQVRDIHKYLNNLYEKRDANGEILEEELENCEKNFKMFSKSY